MKAFREYENAEMWWNGMSVDERRLACRGAGLGQVVAVDSWHWLGYEECVRLIAFFGEMKLGYEMNELDENIILYPVE